MVGYDDIAHVPGVGWIQHGHRLKNFKPNYSLVWPKDGKNGSTGGRWRDIMTNSGPDVFVTASGHKGEALQNRPLRSRWSRWSYMEGDPSGNMVDPRVLNDPFFEEDNLREPIWARPHRERRPDKTYDFGTRKYKTNRGGHWSDAIWRGSNDKCPVPLAYRHHQYDQYFGNPFGQFAFPWPLT